jgi:hypothetical protein
MEQEEGFSLERDDPDLFAKVLKARDDLLKYGYAVVPSLISQERIDGYKSMMWDTLESMSSQYDDFQFKRDCDDYSKYKADNLPLHKHGILELYRINHCQAAREARKDERILKFFSALYGTTQLVCSLDRINFKFPGRAYRSQGDWPHVDQNPRKLGRRCIQAYLNITGTTNEKEPGNRFYKKSHEAFEEFGKPHRGKFDEDWFKLDDEMKHNLPREYKLKLVKPLNPPGSLVLWDSRTIHSPDDGSDFKNGRCVFYMSYLPYQSDTFNTKEELKKSTAFTTMRATPHTPFPQTMFPKSGRTYGKELRYTEIDSIHLFATGLKDLNDDEEKEIALTKYLTPDENEKLLFGFTSYSKLPKNVGLWGKKSETKPLIDMVPMSAPLVALTKETITRRNEAKERKSSTTKKQKK